MKKQAMFTRFAEVATATFTMVKGNRKKEDQSPEQVKEWLDEGYSFESPEAEDEYNALYGGSSDSVYQKVLESDTPMFLSSDERKQLQRYVGENFGSFALPMTDEYPIGKEIEVTAKLEGNKVVQTVKNDNNKSKVSIFFRAILPNGAQFNVNARNITDEQETVLIDNAKLRCVVVAAKLGGTDFRFLNIK